MRTELEKVLDRVLAAKAELVYPPSTIAADYASNVAFRIARDKGREAAEVAAGLQKKLLDSPHASKVFERIELVGGFLNFVLSRAFVQREFLRSSKSKLRRVKKGAKTVLVEYSSPNIGKLLSIAHLRSTVIGDSLARIYRALGYKVITDNHLGDWGLQVGILIAAYKMWGNKQPEKLKLQDLTDLYVRFHEMVKDHPELEAKAKMETRDLQEERSENIRLWRVLLAKTKGELSGVYHALGIKFDYILGESHYRKDFPKVVAETLRRAVARKSEGAIVVPMDRWRMPPLIIQKSDSAYLYGTFDLATARFRQKKFHPNLVLYVISNEQAMYLEQVFRAVEKLGWAKPGELVHVKFGLMRGEDMKRLSTRKGGIVPLDEVIVEAIRRAREIVEKKNPKLSAKEKDKIAKAVGIGALKYNDLSQNRNTDIIFDWDKMLDFEGNSAPYLQYTYARLRSIARKSKAQSPKPKINLKLLEKEEEIALMKKVLQFSEAVEDAAREYAPNLIANYLWELANFANTFYEKYPVLKAEKGLRAARLFLISRIADVLKEGVGLLGIEAPERV